MVLAIFIQDISGSLYADASVNMSEEFSGKVPYYICGEISASPAENASANISEGISGDMPRDTSAKTLCSKDM